MEDSSKEIEKIKEREMFEKSFQRPPNFFKLFPGTQYSIDKKLGILDWQGKYLSKNDIERFDEYYEK